MTTDTTPLQTAGAAAINQLVAYIQQTASFAQGQLPDITKEILTYGAFTAHLHMIVGIIFAVMATVLIVLDLIFGDDGFLAGIGGVVFMLCAVVVVGSYSTAKQIEIAPKLFIMKYVNDAVVKK